MVAMTEGNGVSPRSPRIAIGVDVGGTFTDCILIDGDGEEVRLIKVPSRADEPDKAVAEGVERLVQGTARTPDMVDHFGHGTTVATNTVIEETGAQVGIIVTEGFRDTLFLRRVRFPRPTNMNGPLPSQLVRRRHVVEVAERMDVHGNVLVPVDVNAAIEAARWLIEEQGVSAIAVCFLHAYRNPAHEEAVRQVIEAAYPQVYVSCSANVSPRPREYERFMTTVMNAYVGERMRRYLYALHERARDTGLGAAPLVTRSNGGILNIETAGQLPVHTMLSGPAAGVVGARHCAEEAGFSRIITWDMGGTSLDVAVMDGNIRYTEEASVGEHPLFVPTVDVISIGAGGGSIAWVDPVGMLHVGPRSAGANPGPACYSRGGTEPTLTDAYVALGIIDPVNFASSELKLDPAKSLEALAKLGDRLGMSPLAAAEAILEVATAQIQAKCMPLLARYGIDPEEYALLPYGGAGPTHAFIYARAAGIQRLIVPLYPGLLCAIGTVIADLRFDAPKRVEIALDAMEEDSFNGLLDDLGEQALASLKAQRVGVRDIDIVRSASMRYVGQSFELEIDLSSGRVGREDARQAFLRGYHARYGYSDPKAPIEIVSVVAHAIGHTLKPRLTPRVGPSQGIRSYPRRLYQNGRWIDATAVARDSLRPGDRMRGPLVVDQSDTTTFVPAGFEIRVDEHLNLIGEMIDEAI